MYFLRRPKIVLLGMMTKTPVAGVVWQTLHYLVGFERLGYEVYYVEAHARTPSMLMERPDDDASLKAASFIDDVMRRVDMSDHWAFHALHDDGRCYGLSDTQLYDLYRSASLIVNLHGGTLPLPEHSATGRLVYVETDPVALQIELHYGLKETIDFLEPHAAFFTFGENYGAPDCRLPVSERFEFRSTRQPVVMDWWQTDLAAEPAYTTIGNWRQMWREVVYEGEVYRWSKHEEFLKFIDLPQRTDEPFELAMSSSSYRDDDRALLERNRWQLRDALTFSQDPDRYRAYVQRSRGEFTVAKDQNVRLRSGWFSDRSATYLAAGRPVITQETGFSNVLPVGRGLFAFTSIEDILAAVEAIKSDYEGHCRAATELAREYFSYDVVLGRLLDAVGMQTSVN